MKSAAAESFLTEAGVSGSEEYSRAMLNILEDFAEEKSRLEAMQRAVLNILDDYAGEKTRLEQMEKAMLNILEDLAMEKNLLQQSQGELLHSERAVRASLREKETLLKEVHHRVKNNLQVISSLISLQSRFVPDEGKTRSLLTESQDRIHSIALVHETLYQSGDLAQIDFSGYLKSLVGHLVDSWSGTTAQISVVIQADGVRLPVDVAIPCGLIVNELVTNALKHAFPERGSGAIRVEARRLPDSGISLDVADDGVGLPEAFKLGRSGSLGLELVATLARQLNGKVEVQRHPGTCFHMQLRLPS